MYVSACVGECVCCVCFVYVCGVGAFMCMFVNECVVVCMFVCVCFCVCVCLNKL